MIEHLVISGAGPNGLIQCGMLDELLLTTFSMKNIKSIYCTSAGAFLATFLVLGIPIQDVIDYLIHRRWDKWIKFDLFQFTSTKGFVPSSVLKELIMPFLNAYDIPNTYTLQDLYEKNNIDVHMFTTELNSMISVDLNHISHPTLLLLDALIMTSSIPPIFSPLEYNGKYYVDGGFLNNCPLSTLLLTLDESNYKSVLGINISKKSLEFDLANLSSFEYAEFIIDQCYNVLSSNNANDMYKSKCTYISYECRSVVNPQLWAEFLHNKEYRIEMINLGRQLVKNYNNEYIYENKETRI